jgi:hypothetical protein
MGTRSQSQSLSIDIVPATQDSDNTRDQGERDLVRELERAARGGGLGDAQRATSRVAALYSACGCG